MVFEVLWRPSAMGFYKYGSKIIYEKNKKTVEFENPFMPAGEAIISWHSHTNYQNSRGFLQLPLLKKGKRCSCRTNIRAEPHNSFRIKLNFFNQAGDAVDIVFLKGQGGEFIFPKEAFSYQIQLINTGINKIYFENITITELEN